MPNINDVFPSRYVQASDLQGRDHDLTIERFEMEQMADGETCPVIYFKGHGKGLVLNKTNGRTIAGLYGPNTDHWLGRPITLFPTQTDFQGRQVACIRVRMHAPNASDGHSDLDVPPPPADADAPAENPADDNFPF